jgi:hypothetical protein
MKIDISLPVMARATKRGTGQDIRMLASRVIDYDVPEISARETDVALPKVLQTTHLMAGRTLRELRFHDGKLYRFLTTNFAHEIAVNEGTDLFSRAFSKSAADHSDYVAGTNFQFDPRMDCTPLSRPIARLYQERLLALSMDVSTKANMTWPKVSSHLGYEASDKKRLDEALEQTSSVNAGDLDEAFAMHERQAGRLLVIDDGIWFETLPPCIAVDTRWPIGRASTSLIDVTYRYMPETLEQAPTTVFFPLSKADEAHEMADRLFSRFRMNYVKRIRHEVAVCDHPTFEIDTVGDLIHRTGQGLLSNLLKHVIQRPDTTGHIDAEWVARLADLYQGDNHIIGPKVDYSDDLPEITRIFLETSWNKFVGGLSMMGLPQLRKTLPFVLEMIEDRPISIPEIGYVMPAAR